VSPERWQRLDAVIAAAMEHPLAERAEFVARECGPDDALRADALSLLAAAERGGAFLSGSALDRLARDIAADGWTLQKGERIGPYIVDRLLGAGGSGEVWRARDERLGRDIAIKILLPHLCSDRERVRRFAEEARTAGALNHPNILSVYDVGEHRGAPFLVAECVEGQSLRKHLQAGPLAAPAALAIAVQVARGLAVAHARGIVHRDLKPDNLRLRADGVVKIVDFGLAKLQMPDGSEPGATGTLTGAIIGTAGYIAPEQLRGEPVDGRADLFALGATLYEMLCGRSPFKGDNTVETLHAILTGEPPAISTMAPDVPAPVAAIVTRLLEKMPDARFQSAADLTWALEQVTADHAPPASRSADRSRRFTQPTVRAIAWVTGVATAAVLVLAAMGWRTSVESTVVPPLTTFTWTLPDGMVLGSSPVVSPDGARIAFVGVLAGESRLLLREIASLETVAIPGTVGARLPFWSPDSRRLGFFANGKLMKVELAGAAPIALADAPDPRGGTWSTSGMIVFSADLIGSALSKVSADGGSVEAATLLDETYGDNSHRWPAFLPDGTHFLYFVRSLEDGRRGVYVARADRPATVPGPQLFRSESEAIYAASASGDGLGHVLYVHDGRIEARAFHAARVAPAGSARIIDLSAGDATPYHPSMLSASATVIAFAGALMPFGVRLGSVELAGGDARLRTGRELQNWPRLSPDGRWLARQRIDPLRGNADVWLEDLERGVHLRATTAPEADMMPVWSPDATMFAYVSGMPPGRAGTRRLSIAAADGTGLIAELPCPGESYCEPTDWTRDDDLIVNVRTHAGGDVWRVPVRSNSAAEPLFAQPSFNERDARVSPDGRSIAYVSDEQGKPEVFVRNLSGPAARVIISADGGDQPVWRRDGTELYFVDAVGRLHSVEVRATENGQPTYGAPVELPVPSIGSGHWGTQYDVSEDGRVLYFIDRTAEPPPDEVTVVIGWRALLE
jgi:eukaryotic-like serine/threonine-protein kinase